MSRRPSNIINKTFGKLLVVKELSERKNNRVMFSCLCSCGNSIELRSTSIISGNTKSCGKCKNAVNNVNQNKLSKFYSELLSELQYTKAYTKTENNTLDLVEDNVSIHFRVLEDSNMLILPNVNYNLTMCSEYSEAGYKLITIYENEWENKKQQILNLLKSNLNMYKEKIFARKCTVEQIDKKEAIEFLINNHIQGPGNNNICCFGIKYNNLLLGVMSFGSHHRKSSKIEAVLTRFAIKSGYSIPGGASKLLSHAIQQLKGLGYTKIISWADKRYSNGNVYNKLGFVLEEELQPDYCYYNLNTKQVESKQSNKKSNLKTPVGMTELQHTKILKKERIYDCGKLRFVLDI